MPQEFNVLQCYQCQTFQVHQVKKSKKWNCKMCGEKQSIKKVYGQGSGYDCRQHVQKLNILRAEQVIYSAAEIEESPEEEYDQPQEESNDRDIYQAPVHTQSQPNKWSQYVDAEDDRGDNSEDEELYTTNRNRFDDVNRKSKKRKRCTEESIGNLLKGKSSSRKCNQESPTGNEQLFEYGNFMPDEQNNPNVQERQNILPVKESFHSSSRINNTVLVNTILKNNHFSHDQQNVVSSHELIGHRSADAWEEKNRKVQSVSKEIQKTNKTVTTSSKWGKFVEDGGESSSEESENNENFFIHPGSGENYDFMFSQENQDSETTDSNEICHHFKNSGAVSKFVSKHSLVDQCVISKTTNFPEYQINTSNYSYKTSDSNEKTMMSPQSRYQINIQNKTGQVPMYDQSCLFKVGELNETDFDLEF